MKKSVCFLLAMVMALSMLLAACAGTDTNVPDDSYDENAENDVAMVPDFYRKVARQMNEDGWVFSFVNEGLKDETMDDSDLCKYEYFGINLRYRYDTNYAEKVTFPTQDGTFTQTYERGTLVFGAGSEAQARDHALIDEILDNDRTVEELLALNPEDYTFEELDGEMFFRLMRTALTGEPHREGTEQSYWDKPSYAMLAEPTYVDEYKFQVGFMTATGCVDEVYIDVLYKTGEEYDAYIQLSDMIDDGTATQEQQEAFALIQTIVDDIKANNDFSVGGEEYRNTVLGGIDFSRLYTFLYNIHINNYDMYFADLVILDSEGNEAS